ncbi:hypothetical protein VTN77DRAFT_9590 [Rasamsonia byssochlamydoides]|uniref:uncharacterized protein n=1 Tax=Rasamsonia byssochlamydoides TaxID=89139 RepID=UPI00374455EC
MTVLREWWKLHFIRSFWHFRDRGEWKQNSYRLVGVEQRRFANSTIPLRSAASHFQPIRRTASQSPPWSVISSDSDAFQVSTWPSHSASQRAVSAILPTCRAPRRLRYLNPRRQRHS